MLTDVLFLTLKGPAAIDLHFFSSPRSTVSTKNLFNVQLKEKNYLLLGWPEVEFSF